LNKNNNDKNKKKSISKTKTSKQEMDGIKIKGDHNKKCTNKTKINGQMLFSWNKNKVTKTMRTSKNNQSKAIYLE